MENCHLAGTIVSTQWLFLTVCSSLVKQLKKSSSHTTTSETSCYVYHELGHFLAWISGSRDKTAEFKAIYEKEKSKMTSANHVYNTQNSSEYFAESYREFCINPDGLKKQCPQTYNVIKAAVNYLNSKSDSYLANIKQAYEEIYWN